MQHGVFQEYLNPPENHEDKTLNTQTKSTSPLLPAIDFSSRPNVSKTNPEPERDDSYELCGPSSVERTRSALHTGDFTGDATHITNFSHDFSTREEITNTSPFLGTSPTSPWYTPISPLPSPIRKDPRAFPQHGPNTENRRPTLRDRAPSLQSHSSFFVFRPPTSPLVQQSNNNDEDLSPIERCNSPDKANRRHTLPPHCMPSYKSLHNEHAPISSPQPACQAPFLRREVTVPYQTHRARRSSISNWSLQASTSPQTPSFLRSRRPSISSEASPLQHASMVGSYEESILRGRMSTGPSKPLDFTAQIGALGKGNCRPKYPAHVTVPFPAVFYSWNGGIGRNLASMDDEPSPYVGHIDLENSLPPDQAKEKRRKQRGTTAADDIDISGDAESNNELEIVTVNHDIKGREKRKRRAPSPKAPLGGSYRIPKTGQLQIMIKNPNKTAVKLFLVPYDLEGMEAGTKTFIRQRCYSAGPIVETPLTSGPISHLSQSSTKADPRAKSTLRYLIHLNICCPSKGRYYLYQHIRVVFANRVPDNKESLKNEIQLPEPRYSTYKQTRNSPLITSSASTRSVAEKSQRRRSYGYGSINSSDAYDALDRSHPPAISKENSFPFSREFDTPPVPPLPLILVRSKKERQLKTDDTLDDRMDLDISRPSSEGFQSPLSDKSNRMGDIISTSFRSVSSTSNDGYAKLSRGDVGYGGIFGRPGTPEPGEGLLARRLRSLGAGEMESTGETT